jgi:hypothetical protein
MIVAGDCGYALSMHDSCYLCEFWSLGRKESFPSQALTTAIMAAQRLELPCSPLIWTYIFSFLQRRDLE